MASEMLGILCGRFATGGIGLLRHSIFLGLFFVLLITWALAWVAFKVAGGLIHLLLIIAVISLVLHFFRGRRAV